MWQAYSAFSVRFSGLFPGLVNQNLRSDPAGELWLVGVIAQPNTTHPSPVLTLTGGVCDLALQTAGSHPPCFPASTAAL